MPTDPDDKSEPIPELEFVDPSYDPEHIPEPSQRSPTEPIPELESVEPKSDQEPFRIPEQKHLSPELRAEYRKRGREKKKQKRRKRLIRNIALLGVFLGLGVAIVLYTTRPKLSTEKRADALVIPTTTFQKLLENGDTDELRKYSESLAGNVMSGDLPTQVTALQKRIQIADRLIELGKDVETTNYGIVTKINALMALSGFDILNKYNSNISVELLDFSTKHVNSTYAQVKNRANLGVVASYIHDYVQDNSEQKFDQVKRKFGQLIDELTPEININNEVREILPIVGLSERDDHVREFQSLFATKLKQSNDPELRQYGVNVFDASIIGAVNFYDLNRNVLIPNRDSLVKLESIVDAISARPEVSVPTFLSTLGVVENLHQINEDELEKQLINKLRDSIPRISEDSMRKQVTIALNDCDTRRNLLGKIFDLNGRLAANENLQQMPLATVIVFFSDKTWSSARLISSLKNLDFIDKKEVRFLLVCADESPASDVEQKVRSVFPRGNLIGPPDNVEFLKQCPLMTVPYVIILDQNQRVIRVKVDQEQISSEIAKLMKR